MSTPPRTSNGLSVSIKGLEILFGDFVALEETTLEIRKGELFTLLGPSGCGKTTLLRCLAGFVKSSKGQVFFDDREMSEVEPWNRGIGFVFQNYALWPTKTIAKNVAYGLEMRGLGKKQVEKKVAETLELVELADSAGKFPGELSGGMQQRAALARAVIIDPPLLLFDEPLSNLDAKLRVKLRREIRELQIRLGLTAIYVTHDQEEALDISDRIAVMRQGEVMQIGTPREIYETPANCQVADFVGKASFLRGQATSETVFRLQDGTELNASLKFQSRPENGVTVFSRPEAITFADLDAADLKGVVNEVSYLGNLMRYRIGLDSGQSLLVETRQSAKLGERVGVIFTALTVFDDLPPTQHPEEEEAP